MNMLHRHYEPAKFYTVIPKDGAASKSIGTHAKALDDGALIIFSNEENVVAAFAAGQWLSLSSSLVPMITVNTETGEEVSDRRDDPTVWEVVHTAIPPTW